MAGSRELPVRLFHQFEEQLPSLAGKRVAITGTTSGTGFVAALTCAIKGAEVIMLNRDSTRSQEALRKIQQAAPDGKITQISCDLQSFESVRNAANELVAQCAEGSLDVLACNAGVVTMPNRATVDGFDLQMQTNQLSHFLLVKKLMPLLEAAAQKKGEARIVTVSSMSRWGGPLEAKYFGPSGPHLGSEKGRGALERYHQSKLANVSFVHALTAKLHAAGLSNIKAVSCAPGAAATALFDNSEDPIVPAWAPTCLLGRFAQSAEDGTMPLLTCIVDPDVRSADFICPSRGALWGAGEFTGPVKTLRAPLPKSDEECADPKNQQLMWEECEKAIGEAFTI